MKYRWCWWSSAPAVFGLFALTSCATYKTYQKEPSAAAPSPDSLSHSVFFVGDTGYDPEQGSQTLADMVARADDNSTLLLLGDFTHEEGLPDEDEDERMEAEAVLKTQLDLIKKFPGKKFIVAGDREWGDNQRTSTVEEVEDYIKAYFDDEELLLPEDACSGPDDQEITDNIALLALNSNWWLTDWTYDSEINSDCDIKDRPSFLLAFKDELMGLRDQTVIVALHHPPKATGNYSGHYTLGQHLFPFRDINKYLYLPMPVIGSVYRWLRRGLLSNQELDHTLYKQLTRGLTGRVEDNRNVIFLSGHEHILQYDADTEDGHHFIVAGSGSVRGPAAKGRSKDFTAGQIGYGRLDFYEEGSVWLTFYTKTGDGFREAYRQLVIADRTQPAEAPMEPVGAEQLTRSVVEASVYGDEPPPVSGFYRFMLGEHYRGLYFTPIQLPITRLDTLFGGLVATERGGGLQTQSLRLEDENGRVYNMRSVRKNPYQLLPGLLEESIAADFVKDQFTGAFPFGALVTPRLEAAAGVLHTRPMIRYVPKQRRLGYFNNFFGDEVYLLERRPEGDWSDVASLGNSKNIIDTDDLREEMFDDWKIEADQAAYLRARLMDGLIGDWDRHEGQWNWAETEGDDGQPLFVPIARDRDQSFSHYDGAIAALARLLVPAARKFNTYEKDYHSVRWLNNNGKWNDRLFLNELTREQWLAEARSLQATFTDDLLAAALNDLPDTIHQLAIAEWDLLEKLKSRRDRLLTYAADYYDVLAKKVNVVGTNSGDYFDIERRNDGSLRVRVYDLSDQDEKDELYYDRVFLPGETQEVVIYGQEGKDRFMLSGEGNTPIKVRVVGGENDDQLEHQGGRGRTLVYDKPGSMELKGDTPGVGSRLSPTPIYNQYSYKEFQYDHLAPYPYFIVTPEDGVFLGLGVNWRKYGFKKEPFAQNHRLQAGVSVTNGSVLAAYEGIFTDAFGYRRDLVLNLNYWGPRYQTNFFGLGNETDNPTQNNGDAEKADVDFNRIRQQRTVLYPAYKVNLQSFFSVQIGPRLETVEIEKTAGRFISLADVPERVFDNQYFGGVQASLNLNTLAIPFLPDHGLVLNLDAGWMANLRETGRNFYQMGGELRYYHLFPLPIINIATRIGARHVGGDFEFYQAAILDGRDNLRGYRSNRFAGNTSFYHNTDLRLMLFRLSPRVIPTIVGVLGGFDYGRVWLKGEESDVWHTSYGGGVWLVPLGVGIISATYFQSNEGGRFVLRAGFPF